MSTPTSTEAAQGTPSVLPYPDADLLAVSNLLDPDELAVFEGLRSFFQAEIRPVAVDYWNRGEFPFAVLPKLAEHDLVGMTGGASTHLFSGLVQLELTRADTSVSTFFGVHNELFTQAIRMLGSDDQRTRLLPDLLALRTIGAFALTEPDHGSDISRGIQCSAERVGGKWILRGRKRWIGNAAFCDLVLVWARDVADGRIKGFIVESDRPGFRRTTIGNKIAVRSVQNADLEFDAVRIPDSNRLPGARGFADTNALLCNSRVWVGWQAVGQQFAAFDVAREYTMNRMQFGRPLAATQLVQEQLVRMLGNATMSLSLMVQLARLQDAGSLTMDHAALAKAMCSARMRETVALGRSLLGGNGIVTDFEMAKIFADAEAIYSYEGSYEINALVVGRSITGIAAF